MQFLDKTKRIFSKYSFIFYIALLYVFFALIGIGCPIRFFTGISCFGCGMTRAFLSLIQLDLKNATIYHPLWPFIILIAIFYITMLVLKKNKNVIVDEKIKKIVVVLFAFIFVMVYIIRIIYKDPIVMPDIKSGFLYKLINYFIMKR